MRIKSPVLVLVFILFGVMTGCLSPQNSEEETTKDRYRPAWLDVHNGHRIHPTYSISNDGRIVAFTTLGKPQSTISILEVHSGLIYDIKTESEQDVLLAPDISDDGKKIVFTRGVQGSATINHVLNEIIIADLEGRILDRVHFCNALYKSPVLSPDGDELAYFQYANIGTPADDIGDRGVTLSIINVAMSFDLKAREERQLVDLAWRATSWIDYVADNGSYALRVSDVVRRNRDWGPENNRPVRWGAGSGGGLSILNQFSQEKRSSLYFPKLTWLMPDATDLETSIVGADERSLAGWFIHGVSRDLFLSTYRYAGNDMELRVGAQTALLEQGDLLTKSQLVSSSSDPVHGAAISYNGCFIVDARRPLRSEAVSITVYDICSGKVLRKIDEPKTTERVVELEGVFENDC